MKLRAILISFLFCYTSISYSQKIVETTWIIESNKIVAESGDTVVMYQRNENSIYNLDKITFNFSDDFSYTGKNVYGSEISGSWGLSSDNEEIVIDNIRSNFKFIQNSGFLISSNFQYIDKFGDFKNAISLIEFKNNLLSSLDSEKENLKNSSLFSISPNPSTNFIRIDQLEGDIDINRVVIYNSIGELIYLLPEHKLNELKKSKSIIVNISSFSNGMILTYIESQNDIYIKKIIKK